MKKLIRPLALLLILAASAASFADEMYLKQMTCKDGAPNGNIDNVKVFLTPNTAANSKEDRGMLLVFAYNKRGGFAEIALSTTAKNVAPGVITARIGSGSPEEMLDVEYTLAANGKFELKLSGAPVGGEKKLKCVITGRE